MSFGDELKAARENAELSQTALADLAGLNQKSISNYENGKASPQFDSIEKLESVLGVRFNVVIPQDVPDGATAETPFTAKDEPPKPRKAPAKKAAPRGSSGMPSLRLQLEMPYRLGATALSTRMPATAGVLQRQAGPCAEAWDVFLLRYPKLREKIEQGAVAADIVNLVMVHMPILQMAREEIAAQQMAAQNYEGGLGQSAA